MSRYTRRLTSLRLEYASGLGMVVTPTEGNLTMGAVNSNFAERQRVLDRDVHDGFTLGEDTIQEWAITVQMKNEKLTHATENRILDFIHRRGAFSAAVSLGSATDPVPQFQAICTYNDGTTSTSRTLPLCEADESLADGQPSNTIQITGRNYAAPIDA